MTTSSENDTALAAQPKADTPLPPDTNKQRFKFYLPASLILGIAACSIAAFALYNGVLLQREKNSLQREINVLQQQQNKLSSELAHALSSIETRLQDKIVKLDKNLQLKLEQAHYQEQDWLLLKTRYYLELAQLHAHWDDNLDTASALLEQADKLLANSSDEQIYAIRQAIAKELLQIKSIPALDNAGVLSRLDALQDAILKLPYHQVLAATKPFTIPAKNTSGWRARLHDNIKLLEKLVVIRRHDDAIQPLLTDAQASSIREIIYLNLQEAQWAVLQKNTKVFRLALSQAIKNIKRTFNLDAAKTKAILKSLHSLQKTTLTQQKPELTHSLALLNQLIQANQAKRNAAENGEPSP
ncbi:uroporphyrinogen-III C-methyltransferase [Legionella septentrionalis]|uniref:uroporphyrinogen-III C-methyltransferase n=1 Tax=Legionella septentrionalis TaxID=2498109 RepID=UPI000F8CD9F6|nr:uroporphyrinogen-III C-methyltransferase [Legionella septentrionalis]RUR16467.1 hypothetical protein ELY10_02940 [Legionella septentrionalis]